MALGKIKGIDFTITVMLEAILAVLIASITFAFLLQGLEGQADAATCTGWLRPIISTLQDITGVSLC